MPNFDRLVGDYLVAAAEQAARMKALALQAGPGELGTLRLLAHRLRGSGLSFGFPDITRVAGRIEDLLVEDLAAGRVSTGPLAGLCDDLGDAVARARRTDGGFPDAGPEPDDEEPRASRA